MAAAQSFDRVAADLDRLAELSRDQDDLVSTWLTGLLPAGGRRAIDLGPGILGGPRGIGLAWDAPI